MVVLRITFFIFKKILKRNSKYFKEIFLWMTMDLFGTGFLICLYTAKLMFTCNNFGLQFGYGKKAWLSTPYWRKCSAGFHLFHKIKPV